jgi:hypothetical protein
MEGEKPDIPGHSRRDGVTVGRGLMQQAIADRFAKEAPKFRGESLRWIRSRTGRMPDALREAVEEQWLATESKHGQKTANAELRLCTDKISASGLAMAADDDAICARAVDFSKQSALIWSRSNRLEDVAQAAIRAGIEPPEIKAGITRHGAIKRLCCEKWWRRALRKSHKRWVEHAAIKFGSVRKGRSPYVSADCLASRKGQRARNKSAMAALVAECQETGEVVPMDQIAASTVSNPVNRRNEMMLRMHGMQEFAREAGHTCAFWTITCPSRMHRTATNRKTKAVFDNPKYDGTSPRDAQAYVSNVWARTRAALDRQGVTIYGMRVAEPHHDGTPHWHVLVFATADDMAAAEKEAERYALADSPGEWGRDSSVRFKSKAIIWETDSAGNVVKSPVSYVAKYIAKNLESADIDSLQGERCDQAELKLADALARVDAWRSCWGIRQFQSFGTHAVTIWRELRRIKDGPENDELLPLWQTVHKTEDSAADWHAFMIEMDKLPSLRLASELATEPNAYGEMTAEKLIGLVFTDTGLFEPTRSKRWVIKQSAKREAPWSPLNNCTGEDFKRSGQGPPI